MPEILPWSAACAEYLARFAMKEPFEIHDGF
jgi:hypothetical protein